MDSQQCTWGANEEHHLLHELCSRYVSSAGAKLNWILHLLPIQAILQSYESYSSQEGSKRCPTSRHTGETGANFCSMETRCGPCEVTPWFGFVFAAQEGKS